MERSLSRLSRSDGLSVHLFGIRHHGPGSARSVARALERLAPDIVLVEGPPDADDAIVHVANAALRPPVALLVYALDRPGQCAFYPFAEFSPEWQAVRYALARGIPARFMDLPLGLRYATARASEAPTDADAERAPAEAADANESEREPEDPQTSPAERARHDPLQAIAEASGFRDGEAWWDRMIERGDGEDVFEAIGALMQQSREQLGERDDPHEERREAAMRQAIRAAARDHATIAVVCGAWHVPALAQPMRPARADAELLKGARPVRTAATWVPWSYGRLTAASGYGAGIESPGWYEHLFSRDPSVEAWMTKAARAYRSLQLDISPAHAIEASKLAYALAALRGTPVAGLAEANDAMWSVLCAGDAATFALARAPLFVGDRLGAVGGEVPQPPLVADVASEQKRLRLAAETTAREIDLDLRKPNDRERSILVRRLRALGVAWGTERHGSARSTGTFRESWSLAWRPEFAVELVAASAYGSTLESASNAIVAERAARARELAEVTESIAVAFAAALAQATPFVLARLGELAARTHDAGALLDAIAPLATLRRYGDVRRTDTERVAATLEALVPRACIALPLALLALDDDAATTYAARLGNVDAALRTLEDAAHLERWRATLARLERNDRIHGLVAGRAMRLRFDANAVALETVRDAFERALSRGTAAHDAAAWVEGLLGGSGLVLVHHPELLEVVDRWLSRLESDPFLEALPLVRRTFSTFAPAERRAMAERLLAADGGSARAAARDELDFEPTRIARVLPTLRAILGTSAS